MPEVMLVNMPYAVLERPSIALGNLHTVLEREGFSVRTVHAHLRFAQRVKLSRYRSIFLSASRDLIGEWTFAQAAFRCRPEGYDQQTYQDGWFFDLFESLKISYASFWQMLEDLAAQAEPFVDELAQEILASGARIVGCTSLFQQHCASLALLRRIRELDPSVHTLMGGANCEGPMGVATRRNFPWVDYVVSGEAENLIGPLVRRLMAGPRQLEHRPTEPAVRSSGGLQTPDDGANGVPIASPLHASYGGETPSAYDRPNGVGTPATPRGAHASPLPYGVIGADFVGAAPRASLARVDELPTPNFDDYFRELVATGLHRVIQPALPVETARGCWWGAKHHCTFCGLNGGGMGFRAKPAERALEELAELAGRYQVHDFLVVDNILAMEYFQSVLPVLAEENRGYRMFVETKANLKRSQIEALVRAGVRWLLPGLESLHDEALKLMDKGTTGVANLQTLKWARELGLRVSWTILCGFPGESDDWYAEMASQVPLLVHLQPPGSVSTVGYHRFSPYHEHPEQYGVRYQPSPAYKMVYPIPAEEFEDLAYFFEDAPGSCRSAEEGPGLTALRREVKAWFMLWAAPLPVVLSMTDGQAGLEILDTRPIAPTRRHLLTGLEREVYLACDSAQSVTSLARTLQAEPADLAPVLDSLEGQALLLRQGPRYLALATHGDLPAPSDEFPGGRIREWIADPPWLDRFSPQTQV